MADEIQIIEDTNMTVRGEMGASVGKEVGGQVGAQAGGYAGAAVGGYFGGPIGAAIGQEIGSQLGQQFGEQIGEQIGDQAEEQIKDQLENKDEESTSQEGDGQSEQQQKSKGGGGCSGGAGGAGCGVYSTSDGQCHESPETPKYKLEIEENDIPEYWWDKLPDFDPRVYDAILMEQAAACVNYIFQGLPDMNELENKMESRKNTKTCPKLKVKVPRTKVIKPKEIIYDTKIDDFIKTDQTY